MSEDGDSWLKSAFGLDVAQIAPQLGDDALAYAGAAPAGAALFEQIVTASGAALSESAPALAGGAAVGGVVGVAVVATGVVVGAAAPIVVGYVVGHAEELDQQSDPDERQLPGGVPPDLSPDGGVGPDTGVPQGDPDVPLPNRPTHVPHGPGFDPTIQPPGPAPDFDPDQRNPFEDPFNPRFPRPPRVPEFPADPPLEAPPDLEAPPEGPPSK